METSTFFIILASLVLVETADSDTNSTGLSCLNDYVNNISCTWDGPPLEAGVSCSIYAAKMTKRRGQLNCGDSNMFAPFSQTCIVERRADSRPGCSVAFKNEEFNCLKKLPYISMECDGKSVVKLENYVLCHHIKMRPPGAPSVNSNASETNISWSLSSPTSIFITDFKFEVQSKQEKQTWEEASKMTALRQWLSVASWKLKGRRQVRVRVYPRGFTGGHWSDWSPVTSWDGDPDIQPDTQPSREGTLDPKGWSLGETLVTISVTFSLVLILIILGIYMTCVRKGFRKMKTKVPNPSEYFHQIQAQHGGNLKMWLNPLAVSESFFTSLPDEHISSIVLCNSTDVLCNSTDALLCSCPAVLYLQAHCSAGSDTSGVTDTSSSSSSSHFSNMGYFLSSSSGCSTRTQPNPAYFTYRDDFQHLHHSHHVRLCPSFTALPAYEGLVSEPQSPDSGFDIREEDEKEEERVANAAVEEAPGDQTSPLLILPLHLHSWASGPSSAPARPDPPCLFQRSSAEPQQREEPEPAEGGSYAAWPQAGAMCRSSSMPVEPSKTGYLTLKELQTTFSNKSI